MKALTLDNKYIAFFGRNVTEQRILWWVNDHITHDSNIFGLHECYSCTAQFSHSDTSTINIYGDEDSISLQIVDIVPELI